jgi:G:T/U-mismatch repair DNA glycosylase
MLVTHGILPDPGDRFHDETFLENRLGITDLAKCPSPRANALTREDIETGRAILRRKIERYQPNLVCSIYKSTLEVLTGRKYTRRFGLLPDRIGETRLFAAPFPYRPANDVRKYFTQLRRLVDEARAEPHGKISHHLVLLGGSR